jgi:hypothetical protein
MKNIGQNVEKNRQLRPRLLRSSSLIGEIDDTSYSRRCSFFSFFLNKKDARREKLAAYKYAYYISTNGYPD